MPSGRITLIKGRQATRSDGSLSTAGRVVSLSEQSPWNPWGAARGWLEQLEPAAGTLDAHKPLLSLVYPSFEKDLDAQGLRSRDDHSPHRLAFLPTTTLDPRPLLRTWAQALTDTVRARVVVTIANVWSLDTESAALLRPWLARARQRKAMLHIVLGCPARPQPADFFDSLRLESIAAELHLLEALPCTAVEERAAEGADVQGGAEKTARRSDPATRATQLADRMKAIRHAFGCYAFLTAFKLAQELLEETARPATRAALHEYAGLSALYLAQHGLLPETLVPYVEHHLDAALEQQSAPARRAHLLYSRCMLAARIKGDVEAGLGYAEDALQAALTGAIAPGLQHYLEAWTRNARAYSLFRLGRTAEGTQECEQAHRLLCAAPAHADVPADSYLISRFFVLSNLSRLAFQCGDRARSAKFERSCLAVREAIPMDRRPEFSWLKVDYEAPDLAAQAETLRQRLEHVHGDLNLPLEALYAHELACLEFRLGEAERALHNYEHTLAILQAFEDDPVNIFTTLLNCCVTAYRAGEVRQAERALERALHHPVCEGETTAEVLAALAMVAARGGDAKKAVRFGERAVAFISEHRAPDVQLRVHRCRAEAYLALHRQAEARAALEEAARVAHEHPEEIPAEDEFGLIAMRAESKMADVGDLRRALQLGQDALADVNAWWDLARLLPVVAHALETGRLELETDDERDALHCILQAAGQRHDCRHVAARIASWMVRARGVAEPSRQAGES